MDINVVLEMLLRYLPDLLECLSRMPDERRVRLISLLQDERARTLLLRLLQQTETDPHLQSLIAVFGK